jgi:DNA-binding transcriptional LysR family regulator
MDSMNERELRAFVAIVEAGRMDHAASSLGYSQPAISYQIKCLEQQLGARLFFRHPDGAHLTPEGAMVLPSARAVLTLLDGIKEVTGRQHRTATIEELRAAG